MWIKSLCIFIPFLFSDLSVERTTRVFDFTKFIPGEHTLSISDPDFESLTIPVRIIGELIVIEANVDGQVGNFILDTGAPTLILNKTYFRDDARISNFSGVGLDGTKYDAYTAFVKTFEIQELKIEKISARVSELRKIEDHIGIKLLGLIGVSMLQNFVITLDMNESLIHIANNNETSTRYDRLRSIAPDFTIPFEYESHTISIIGAIGGQKLRFILDTGAETNVLNTRMPKKVMKEVSIQKRILLNGSTGGQVEALAGIVQNTEIGGLSFVKMRTIVISLHQLREAYGYRVDGMLGYDFFARGVVTIDFTNREISMNLYNNLMSNE